MSNKFVKIVRIIIIIFFNASLVYSQNSNKAKYNKTIADDSSLTPVISEILLARINDYHAKHGLDSLFFNQVLINAAVNQADYMSLNNDANLEQKG
jgi:uncharacterized protein YkwD